MDQLAIILGFTGSIGSGCSYISRKISDISGKYKYFKLSEIIREHLSPEEIQVGMTIETMQNKGNELRAEHGKKYLIETLIRKIKEDPQYKDCNEIIIDGIKNKEEINLLRFFPFFYLFSIHADREIRLKRSSSNGVVKSDDEFYRADKRDELEQDDNGQQVKECDYLADIILLNNDEIPTHPPRRRETCVRKIYERYIVPIENLREGKKSPDIKPSIDELAMTTAYAVSKLSSCEKRKVGVVIVNVQKPSGDIDIDQNKKVTEIPYLISSGYNEVPIGSYMCVYDPEYEKCYRDHQQELYAPKIIHCPNCGEKVEINIECHKCKKIYNYFIKVCKECHSEINADIICKCGKNIFKEYLPGSRETPGKLLDLCRSLHAEENAILNLIRTGTKLDENMIIYTTTQPCNLCANKIVTAGIKQVVFAEPYFMKESATIFERGGVKVTRFQGVKSSAYFRLYQ